MDFLQGLWLGGEATELETENLRLLLVAVLPVFTKTAIRKHHNLSDNAENDTSSTEIKDFYIKFITQSINLDSYLRRWDPMKTIQRLTRDEADVRNKMLEILKELERRFLSRKDRNAGPVFKHLGFECIAEETFPKVHALRKILQARELSEDFLEDIDVIIRIDNNDRKKRTRLLQKLNQAVVFFFHLLEFTIDSDLPCPIRFSEYPLKHMSDCTENVFNLLRENWICQCPRDVFHASRKTRLSLTKHQRFETAPDRNTRPYLDIRFRILFPTSFCNNEWQDTDIAVVERRSHNINTGSTIVSKDLCRVIQGVKPGIIPRMVACKKVLWQLEPDIDISQLNRVEDDDFKSLKYLLRSGRNGGESLMSSIGGEDRLILSFVLTTSLLHFFRGPWLQQGLNNENICFVVSHQTLMPDITKPYFTTSCSPPNPVSPTREINQPHRFPDILSLGILLLEIARGAPIEYDKSQDRCVMANLCKDNWATASQTSRGRNIYDCFAPAISACIEPGESRYVLDSFEARKYIFERVLYPIEKALSNAFEVQSNTIQARIDRERTVKGASQIGSFDHQDQDRMPRTGPTCTKEWLKKIKGVHNLYDECEKKCGEAAKRATRVKIAVLDTGLQLPGILEAAYLDDERINSQQSESFLMGKPGHDWKVDGDGHGSRVGQIILDVSPAADLHVARVFESSKDLSDSRTAARAHKSVAEAINRATYEWKVDMIIMCFGFDEPIPLISKAIEKALKTEKPPLFFAATRNNGAHKRMAWPASDTSVIGISSTAGDGNDSSFNPLDKGVHNILYAFGEGVPVKVAAPADPNGYTTTYVSGTSYATPVAAALAANLLGCMRMMATSSSENRLQYSHVSEGLRQMKGMMAVLEGRMLKKHNRSRVKSLLPWDFLTAKLLDNNELLKQVAESLRQVLGDESSVT